ncbi:MAG: arginyltransferase [Spirochaetes bacterium]|nr:arginyltransferase [Spirochaetota bacterium]
MTAVIRKNFIDSLPSYYSGECSYFGGRESYIRAFKCSELMSDESVDYLLENGFRRCGELFYITDCGSCSSCVSYRVLLDKIRLSASQKRILKRGRDVIMKVNPPLLTDEKRAMYVDYQRHKHSENAENKNDSELMDSMMTQMFREFGNTIQFEFFINNRLIGYVTADSGFSSLSAVYSVYDVSLMKMSPGKLFILRIMEWAKLKYKYFYLGFYIENHEKMNYKSEFGISEILDPEKHIWVLSDYS